jgi:signal peptidase II
MLALVFDQLSKLYAEHFHLLSPPVPSMAHHRATSETALMLASDTGETFFAFYVTHVANAGVMLGALEDASPPVPWLAFMLTTALGLGVAGGLLRSAAPTDGVLRFAAVLLGAGIFGNLIDRVRLGYVVDWVHLRWKVAGWFFDAPAFNLADLLILGGAALASIAIGRRWATSRARTRVPGMSA